MVQWSAANDVEDPSVLGHTAQRDQLRTTFQVGSLTCRRQQKDRGPLSTPRDSVEVLAPVENAMFNVHPDVSALDSQLYLCRNVCGQFVSESQPKQLDVPCAGIFVASLRDLVFEFKVTAHDQSAVVGGPVCLSHQRCGVDTTVCAVYFCGQTCGIQRRRDGKFRRGWSAQVRSLCSS